MGFNFKTEEYTDDKPKQLKEYGLLKMDFYGTVVANVYIDGNATPVTETFTSVGARKQEERKIFVNGRRFYIVFQDSSDAKGYVYSWELGRIPILCGSDNALVPFYYRTLEDNLGKLTVKKVFRELCIDFKGGVSTPSTTLQASFLTTVYDGSATSVRGLSMVADNTLRVVDDNTNRVYNIETDGTLKSSFLATVIDPPSDAPHGIGVAGDGSFWVTDYNRLRIYHIDNTGTLLSSFLTSAYDALAIDPRGITVLGDGNLLITDGSTKKIYKVTTAGVLISSFEKAG